MAPPGTLELVSLHSESLQHLATSALFHSKDAGCLTWLANIGQPGEGALLM